MHVLSAAHIGVFHLAAVLADAELTLAVASATDAIREVRGQEAINMLAASVANAEISISLADAGELIDSISDSQMLAELDDSLINANVGDANDLIMAVVSERPMLASAVQNMALDAGYNEGLVASAVIGGLGGAEATAAGK